MSGARDRADALRALHAPAAAPLVLVNVWDAVSARVVAAQPGCTALATASWAVAAAHGYPDGEHLPRDLLLAALARIAGATDLPVSADLERGYGDVGETVRLAVDAGIVGCNLEDGTGDRAAPLCDLREASERVATAVGAGADAGVPLVVNARTDAFLAGVDDALDVAVERGRAFLEAGADCVFVPGVADGPTIERLVAAIGPVSVLATPASPTLAELAALGVRRVSVGPGALGVATQALGAAAAALLRGEAYPAGLAHRPPGPAR